MAQSGRSGQGLGDQEIILVFMLSAMDGHRGGFIREATQLNMQFRKTTLALHVEWCVGAIMEAEIPVGILFH